MAAAAPATTQVDTQSANTDYMMRSRRFPVRMLTIGGNLSGTYALNSTLNYIMPPVNNGWLDMLELDINIQVTGAVATLTPNAAFPWNLIQAVTVNLDGQISYIEPYEVFLYELTRKRLGLPPAITAVAPFGSNANLSSILYSVPSGAGSVIIGANNIRFRLRIPLNALHPLDGAGLLPCQGTQDPVQINVLLPNALVGNDPYLFPFNSATGTASITGVSTINMYGWVRDGRTMWAPNEQLPFYPDGLPQVSYDRQPDVVNLQVNQIIRGQMTKVLKVYYMWSIIIDGNSSTAFASNTNINSYDLSADSTGNFKYQQFGLENIPIDLLWEDRRAVFEQDFPQGVIPVVFAPQRGLPEIGLGNANDILNMTAGGWTSLYQGINLATMNGVTGIQPRIHTLLIGANDSPYIG